MRWWNKGDEKEGNYGSPKGAAKEDVGSPSGSKWISKELNTNSITPGWLADNGDQPQYGYAPKNNVFGWKNSPYDMEPMYRYGTMPTPYNPQGGDPYNTVLPGYADNPNFKNWGAVNNELNYFRENNPAILTPGTPENDYMQAYNRVAAAEDYPNQPSNATPEDYDRILMEYLKYLQ